MAFSTVGKNQMLDGLTVDRIRLHSADPGASGTTAALGSLTSATFSAASSGSRVLSGNVDFTGLGASQSVTYFSIWLNSGTVFKGSGQITSGDTTANSSGEYRLTTATALTLTG
jgi:hypothetical protein